MISSISFHIDSIICQVAGPRRGELIELTMEIVVSRGSQCKDHTRNIQATVGRTLDSADTVLDIKDLDIVLLDM